MLFELRQNWAPEDRVNAAQVEIIVRDLSALPTFPSMAARLVDIAIEAARAESPQARQSVIDQAMAVAALDPPTACRILSAAAAKGAAADSISAAARSIGFDALRAILLSAETFDQTPIMTGDLDLAAFWKHSLAVAIAAEMLAENSGGAVSPEQAYTCGLLHDLGTLALVRCLPKSYTRAMEASRAARSDRGECEQAVIGVRHNTMGLRLAEHWRLGRVICDVIWLCDSPVAAIPELLSSPETVALVSLADAIANELSLGCGDESRPLRNSVQLAVDMGMPVAAVEDVKNHLQEKVESKFFSPALPPVLSSASVSALASAAHTGQPSLKDTTARANAELVRMNEELLARTEQLSAKASALEHIDGFMCGRTSEATTSDVLEQITAVVAALATTAPSPDVPVIAYSVDSQSRAGVAVLNRGCNRLAWNVFDAVFESEWAKDISAVSAGELVAMLSAGVHDPGQWIARPRCAHLPLFSGGAWVGGVLYTSPSEASATVKASVDLVAGALGMSLSIAQGSARQKHLSDQLAGASQALSAAQEALAEASVLSAIGEMATGAAHELNTPLAVISGRAQLMRSRSNTDEDKKTWQLITEQAHCISDIISELMAFASPPAAEISDFDVAGLLTEVAESFTSSDHPQASSGKVDIHTGEGPMRVRADRSQIRAAMLELLVNAANAAADKLTVSIVAQSDEANGSVLLLVRDSGSGMDEQTARRAFTPFFSLQKAGRRRGLGLSYVKRVVESNGGRIWIDSRLGEGATVTLQLPMAR